MGPNSRERLPGRWRDRVKEYMCERGATRGGGLDQARRECLDRERWRLFYRNPSPSSRLSKVDAHHILDHNKGSDDIGDDAILWNRSLKRADKEESDQDVSQAGYVGVTG